MAQSCFRLRRALTSLAALRRPASSSVATLSAPPLLKLSSSISHLQSRPFRSSATISLSSNKKYHLYKEGDEITPDTILFEGCDYNHWLITMDFPRDPNLKPPPDEMVRIYEQTCAQGLNISLEEAKKRMYACSTTTYEGFQAIMTEEESKKFESLPGVVFVLPDSYIDPVNKEYGGDKYENGVITRRPPPVYHNTGGRFRDQNRRSSRPRNTWQEDAVQNQQGGPIQGDGRNYRAPQNVPSQQNYPPRPNYQPQQNHPLQQNVVNPGQGERWGPMPVNNTDNARGGREFYQADRRGRMPSYQGSYNQGQQGNGYPSQADQRGCGQNNFASGNMNYTPPSPGGTYGQGMGSNYGQSWQGTSQGFSQMGRGNGEGDSRNYEPMGQTSTNQGSYNQGQQGNGYPSQADQRGYGQNNFASGNMNYTPPSPGGTYGQGMGSNYGQSWQGTSQGFSQMGHGNGEGDSRNYEPMGQTSTNQGRY